MTFVIGPGDPFPLHWVLDHQHSQHVLGVWEQEVYDSLPTLGGLVHFSNLYIIHCFLNLNWEL